MIPPHVPAQPADTETATAVRYRYRRAWALGACRRTLAVAGLALLSAVHTVANADDVFLYSSTTEIRGINLDLGTENVLTTSPFTSSINALATNSDDGLVYYGNETAVYVWDVALGAGAAAHSLLNDFASGTVQAPINNLESGSGSYVNGVYYVGSEDNAAADAEDIYALTMSADGRTVVSAQALGLLTACNCTGDEIGGFGDIAAVMEAGGTVLYGITTGGSDATKTGRWRFNLSTSTFTHLANGANGQLSNSISGQLYTNLDNSIRTLDKNTGALGSTNLFTLAATIYDFTGGFSLDFGDAPATYGSAIHRVPAQVAATTYLGTLPPDNEAGTLDSAAGGLSGLGDDQSGVDDEDAVASLNTLDSSQTSYAFTVSCSAGAYVSAWIDFNRNGTFDAGERSNNAPQTCTGTSTALVWTGLTNNVAGATYARIRVADASSDIALPSGISNTGEVEDHGLAITDSSTGSCATGQISTVYASNDVPKVIPVGSTSATSSTLNIPDALSIQDLNVIDVVGTHTWLDDIVLTLIRSGTNVSLFGRSCGNNDNFDFGFDDESTTALVCPPVNGNNIAPGSALSVFDGTASNGDWVLDIQDVYPTADGGVLQSWALQICSPAGAPQNADIRVGKVASVEGTKVTMTFRVFNAGNVPLTAISLIDDLDSAFGAGTYSIFQAPQIVSAPVGFSANATYTGNGSDTNLLGPGGTLAPAEDIRVRLVVDINTLPTGISQASYTNQAEVSAISASSSFSQDLSAPSMDLSIDRDIPTPIVLQNKLSLSGRVFVDSSASSVNSHDGIIQPGETGVGGRQVSVLDSTSGQMIASTVSNGNGDWTIALSGSYSGIPVNISVQAETDWPFISEAAGYSAGAVTDGVVQATPLAGTTVSGINVGVVSRPSMQLDQTQTAPPGATVRHAHRYQASSPGQLQFTLSSTTSPSGPAWPTRLITDLNCNGHIDSGDANVVAALTVTKDEMVCLIVDVFIATNIPQGATHTATLKATLTLDDAASTGHAVTFDNINTDLIRVVSPDSGRLLLTKTVRNITLNGAVSQSNTGLPGHVLEYTLHYENQGTTPISDLLINDSAPAYTQVLSGSVQCGTTPVATSCTPGVSSANVHWTFTGSVPAGASGTVVYQVTID